MSLPLRMTIIAVIIIMQTRMLEANDANPPRMLEAASPSPLSTFSLSRSVMLLMISSIFKMSKTANVIFSKVRSGPLFFVLDTIWAPFWKCHKIAKKFGDLNRDLISAAQAARIATVRQLHQETPNSELITMSDDYDVNMMTEELEYNYNMMMIR